MKFKLSHLISLIIGGIFLVTFVITTIFYFLFAVINWDILIPNWNVISQVFFGVIVVVCVIIVIFFYIFNFEDLIDWFLERLKELNRERRY